MGVLWIAGIVAIIITIAVAVKFDEIATDKGYDSGYGWWVFFTGIFGMIMVAALPDKSRKEQVIIKNEPEPKSEKLPEI